MLNSLFITGTFLKESTVYEQRDKSLPKKHHAQILEIEPTGVQLKPETYIEWSRALT